MKLEYVPLLPVQRALHDIPRGVVVNGAPKRFRQYLRTMASADGTGLDLPPLVAINPMAKDHVTARLDALLALAADEIAARATAERKAQRRTEVLRLVSVAVLVATGVGAGPARSSGPGGW